MKSNIIYRFAEAFQPVFLWFGVGILFCVPVLWSTQWWTGLVSLIFSLVSSFLIKYDPDNKTKL